MNVSEEKCWVFFFGTRGEPMHYIREWSVDNQTLGNLGNESSSSETSYLLSLVSRMYTDKRDKN